MHDIRNLRAEPDLFDRALRRRGLTPHADEVLKLDIRAREMQRQYEAHQALGKQFAARIGAAAKEGDLALVERLRVEALGHKERDGAPGFPDDLEITETRDRLLSTLPNILDPDVPDGADETANVVLHSHGTPPARDFTPKQHFELGEALGLMEFTTAAKLAGSRFTVLRGDLARLERALGQWMLDLHTREHGCTEISPPLLVNEASVFGTGQLPKFGDDLFRTTDGRYLIPTAEVPLTNLVAGEILADKDLPLRFAALTPCFRSEAGSAGRDTRGMLRQHQFQKVELVSVTRPQDSDAEHERMTSCAERILTELGLVWRRVLLCAGDTGFSAAKTYDLEVWLPGQGAWREISSCSNCRAFQARRMGARYRTPGVNGKKGGTEYVHTLNGSGVAVGRALIAVLETFQQADGTVTVPAPLLPYLGGLDRIGRT